MGNQNKSERAHNFTAEEKRMLIAMVEENFEIIEMKKKENNSNTNNMKNECWEGIAE